MEKNDCVALNCMVLGAEMASRLVVLFRLRRFNQKLPTS